MKIAISAEKDTIESMIDQRFGRCRYFLIFDTEKDELIKAAENEGAVQGHGAGIKAAEQIGKLGAQAVLTGDVGPNATDVLGQLGIKTYHASGTALDAVEKFKNNELKGITEIAPAHAGTAPQEQQSDERIFFPLLDNSGKDSKISPHFGHAPFFGLYDTKTEEFSITENTLSHTDPDKSPVDQIVEAVNPTTVYAQGIGSRAIMLFNERGIKLKTGPYETVKDALANLDKLEEQASGCGHEHHH